MTLLARVPFLGTNDVECEVVAWKVDEGTPVKKGFTICVVETTKTAMDIEAPEDGLVHRLAAVGERLAVGAPLALLSTERVPDARAIVAELQSKENIKAPMGNITRKAELLLARHAIPIEEIRRFAGDARISEQIIEDFLAAQAVSRRRHGFVNLERIGIVGGVSGGGALIVVDALRRQAEASAVAIFDRAAQFHGSEVLGVPVVGSTDLVVKWFAEKRLDAVVIAFNRNLEDRARVFLELQSAGVKFCNVIDPTAELRSGVQIGTGNVILGRVYIGACSEIGNNNFISGGVWLEHGNRLGNHCGFGPGVATSGNVWIGNQVRFGTGIFIEPGLRVGDRAIVASGAILTADVADDHVVRVEYNLSTKLRGAQSVSSTGGKDG